MESASPYISCGVISFALYDFLFDRISLSLMCANDFRPLQASCERLVTCQVYGVIELMEAGTAPRGQVDLSSGDR